MSEAQKNIYDKLKKELDAVDLDVIDLSGGCGTMYRVQISSKKFKGKSLLEQHRMVQDLLKEEIKQMHGLTIKTAVID